MIHTLYLTTRVSLPPSTFFPFLTRPRTPFSIFPRYPTSPSPSKCSFFFFFLITRHPPRSPLFPYTPLSRSVAVGGGIRQSLPLPTATADCSSRVHHFQLAAVPTRMPAMS